MNKEARPFEEYKEMIQDMSKDNMIKGLYDLSANIIEKDKEIERLNNIITNLTTVHFTGINYNDLVKENKRLNNIMDEIRKIVKHEKEELDKFKGVDLLINTYQQVFGVMLEMLELKEGKK